jgi:hypothetical protein
MDFLLSGSDYLSSFSACFLAIWLRSDPLFAGSPNDMLAIQF